MLTRTVINPCDLALSSLPCHPPRAFSPPPTAAFVARSSAGSAFKAWRLSFSDSGKRYGGQATTTKSQLRLVRGSATREQEQQPLRTQQQRREPEPGWVQFAAERSVSIPCPQIRVPATEWPAVRPAGSGAGDGQVVSVDEYLADETERIVRVVFPDSKRLARVDEDLWRVLMRPVTFFSISATPICLLRVYHDGTSLRLFSNQLQLDFIGAPAAMQEIPFRLSLDGQLTPSHSASPAPYSSPPPPPPRLDPPPLPLSPRTACWEVRCSWALRRACPCRSL
ncbi:hypothetical protein CLOM_g21355 [Closterium sp. NIES-68]|nr:hypothetical protein CLOM_g21355 [Closterium sp. NIES-68]